MTFSLQRKKYSLDIHIGIQSIKRKAAERKAKRTRRTTEMNIKSRVREWKRKRTRDLNWEQRAMKYLITFHPFQILHTESQRDSLSLYASCVEYDGRFCAWSKNLIQIIFFATIFQNGFFEFYLNKQLKVDLIKLKSLQEDDMAVVAVGECEDELRWDVDFIWKVIENMKEKNFSRWTQTYQKYSNNIQHRRV